MEQAAPDTTAAPDAETLLQHDLRLTWRTLVALGIPESYRVELCSDALLSVPRDAQGGRPDDPASRLAVYEAAVREATHFGRGFVDHPEAPAQLAGNHVPPQERDLLQGLSDGLSELSMAEQEIFRLFEIHRLPIEEVGLLLDVSSEFAQAQLGSARRRLRRSRGAAGRPVQRDGLFAMMRIWHAPSPQQAQQVHATTLKALAGGGGAPGWLGPTLALLLSAALAGGLWFAISQLGGGG